MNIMIIRDAFNIHGPGLHAFAFGNELTKRGHSVVFCAGSGELDEAIKSKGMKKYTIEGLSFSNHRVLRLGSNAKKIRRILKENSIQIVIGFNLLSTVAAKMAGLFFNNIKYIDVVVGEGKEKALKYFPFIYIAISEYMKKRLISFGVSEKKIHIVYPSTLDLDKFDKSLSNRDNIRKEFGINDNDILITSVAMFNSIEDRTTKGQDMIARCIPELVKRNSSIHVLFVGDGEKRKVIQEELIDYQNNVHFVGKRNDVPSILFASDIFCHYPSQETFGMVITEAMAARLPVVAHKVGGISDIIVAEETGYLVKELDEFVNRLVEISINPQLRMDMGEKGRKRVEKKYTLIRVIDSLEKLF